MTAPETKTVQRCLRCGHIRDWHKGSGCDDIRKVTHCAQPHHAEEGWGEPEEIPWWPHVSFRVGGSR